MRPTTMNRIFVVDDHPIVRSGLSQLFSREPGFVVCGEAGSVAEALSAIPQARPDLVISDLTLEGRSGLELTRQLTAFHPDIPVLIVSMHDEMLYAERALAAGARGYLTKRHAEEELLHAAREVIAGRLVVSGGIRGRARTSSTPASPISLLTDRELEVFLLIGQGYAPRHIAEKLSLSVSTIEVYRDRLKEKLNLGNSALLLRYAVRWCKDHDTE